MLPFLFLYKSSNTMTFIEYCESKKIDSNHFAKEDPKLYADWNSYFVKTHSESFTQQKKFLINQIRLKYPLLNN